MGPRDWPGQVGGDQLPDLTGDHAGDEAQHQRPLPHQALLPSHEVVALRLVVAPVQLHLHHGLGPGNAGHDLAGEVDGAQHLHDAAEEESHAEADSSCTHGSSPAVG